ncbi:MAG TPA: hypothetical protein VFA77_00910, partial [Candidatus Eisenbacteria bacterium]|nr:hypothetical protein [Candidatus Eisenbacteria bacterium]
MKKESQITGVQKVFSTQTWRWEGGSSCHTPRVRDPESKMAKNRKNNELTTRATFTVMAREKVPGGA